MPKGRQGKAKAPVYLVVDPGAVVDYVVRVMALLWLGQMLL
ncbi:hypothetical protein ACWDYH_36710 [Nocardia goodfellowii]